MTETFRSADPFGIQRVIEPPGVLPQQAERIDPSLPIAEDELLIQVESLNIDSASFHQISGACSGDLMKMESHILELVKRRGKHHNPVTGSGGMLIGRVKEIGPKFPQDKKPIQVGDRIATLISLSLTPLHIERIKKIHPRIDRVDVDGYAIVFSSGLFAKLPSDLPETVALAVLDVAGAPAQTQKLVQDNQTVVVIGGGGKSGVLCLYEAKKKKGVRTIAIDYSQEAIERLKKLSFVDEVIQVDARQAVEVMKRVQALTHHKQADVVINVANIPETEMSCILSCRTGGIVYFFSMATSFTRAALGAEGVGADLDLRIGNGYTAGHAEFSLNLLRESSELKKLFMETYS
ncbi:L-erythro-3,5-diaminohexanoate dehydrogenase [bacterium]|jgi:L-erythro-3,5-diaminohexanoate dehydrogenase|nr:L-erythro-3,5-diaminohexanoate dehydrogenase [bacterium]